VRSCRRDGRCRGVGCFWRGGWQIGGRDEQREARAAREGDTYTRDGHTAHTCGRHYICATTTVRNHNILMIKNFVSSCSFDGVLRFCGYDITRCNNNIILYAAGDYMGDPGPRRCRR